MRLNGSIVDIRKESFFLLNVAVSTYFCSDKSSQKSKERLRRKIDLSAESHGKISLPSLFPFLIFYSVTSASKESKHKYKIKIKSIQISFFFVQVQYISIKIKT